MTVFPVVIAIPARNEVELLPQCLAALAGQTDIDPARFAVVASCNNCTDGTAAAIRQMTLPFALQVDEVSLPADIAHAGGARRAAMDAAAGLCGDDGIVVTTDADGVPAADWVAATVAAFVPGIAAVAGRVSTDWDQLSQFPADVLDVGAREWDYQLLSAELDAYGDPEPHDPWPRHNQTCGANMAITRDWYGRIGGLPVLRTGEDGAMFDAVRHRDGLIRHDMASHVTVSARLVGRAQGGMADALSLRHGDAYECDDLLEPADDLLRRATWRHRARAAYRAGVLTHWAAQVGIAPMLALRAAVCDTFGAAWAALETAEPRLAKHRLTAAALDTELARIRTLRAKLPAVPQGLAA